MTMNLLKVSKEIKKINETLDYLKTQNTDFLSHISTNHDLITITDEIKNNMNEIHSKIDQIYNFNINCKFDYENKNYNYIKEFLLELNIDKILINKILFLNFNSLNEILLTDEEIFEKLEIPKNTINLIKTKIQEKIYISNIEY